MPQAIVFDLFGVIAKPQTAEAKRAIETIAGVAGEADEAFWKAYWACRGPYDAGQPSVEYWSEVAGRVGARWSPEIVDGLIEADLASWCDADDSMVDLVAELAGQGRVLGLLSNITEDLVPRFEARHGHWLSHFTVRTYSCRIGTAKPDPSAYEICAERLGVPPRECVFFDDAERNVVAAREVGMTAAVFRSAEQVRALLAG